MIRLIIDKTDIFTNLALDEACLELVSRGEAPETVRLSEITRPAISLGANQKVDEVNSYACAKLGWDVCYRKTGGTLAFLHPESKILVSHIYRKEASDIDQVQHTREFCKKLMLSLNALGIENVELWNKCDIMVSSEGRWQKIGSAATALEKNAVLVHATLNYSYSKELLCDFFSAVKPFGEKIPDTRQAADTAYAFIGTITHSTKANRETIYEAIKKQFNAGHQAHWSQSERELAAKLTNKGASADAMYKGLCDFGLGPYIPSFVLKNGKAIALPDTLAIKISERHALVNCELSNIQSITKEGQLMAYREWLATLKP